MNLKRFLELMNKYDFMIIKHRNNGLWPIEIEDPVKIFNTYGEDVELYETKHLKKEFWGN